MAARKSTVIGVLIVLVSILGAGVTWRAAGASGTAADLDQRARQARIQEAQIRAESSAVIEFEERLFAAYRDHHRLAKLLDQSGEHVRAQEERAAARTAQPLFLAEAPFDDAWTPRYRRQAAQKFMDDDLRLTELQPEELERAADEGRRKRFWLVVVDTVLIASIFFSTLALLGSAPGRRPAAAGLLLAVGASAGLVLVELAVTVPAA